MSGLRGTERSYLQHKRGLERMYIALHRGMLSQLATWLTLESRSDRFGRGRPEALPVRNLLAGREPE